MTLASSKLEQALLIVFSHIRTRDSSVAVRDLLDVLVEQKLREHLEELNYSELVALCKEIKRARRAEEIP